jgi:hypothetical protein
VSVIVIRLHPDKPTDGMTFEQSLEGLTITVADRSFTDPKGTANVLGTAVYDPSHPANDTIVQHQMSLLDPTPAPVATAAIEIADPLGYSEYGTPDLTLTVQRTPSGGGAAETIVNHDINFNIDLASGPLPAPDPVDYMQLDPVSLYLTIPPSSVALGPGVAFLEVPTDGTPPPYDAVHQAVTTVLAADPGGVVDPSALTVDQCRYIANEIVNNRMLDPFPVPSKPLEQLYAGGAEDERRQFESDLQTYYTVHNTRADVLTKFIYSMSAALACEQRTAAATAVGFSFPILPGLTPKGLKVAEATVVVSQ